MAISCQSGSAQESEVVVFAASSLTEAADGLIAALPPGIDAELVLGGSAALAAQIRDGAPADLFLSADRRWADRVIEGCGPNCSARPFATNSLVLAVPSGNPGDVRSVDDLARSDLRVVLCSPEVPCGELSMQVTDASGVTPDADSLETSVRAVRALLELDEADVGLIYATDVNDSIDVIPDDRIDHFATTYFYVILGGTDTASRELTGLIDGPTGQMVLADLGFGEVGS
jgi:molybdate transport system substrate-binding protein